MIDYSEEQKDIQVDRMIDNFIEECEQEAAKLEITVDYYIAEFLWWQEKQNFFLHCSRFITSLNCWMMVPMQHFLHHIYFLLSSNVNVNSLF